MVSNLLSNAAKYTDEGGRISLAAQPEGDEIVIRVRDNGIGLAEASRGQVFEMFSQVSAALHRADGGLGIGLALSRGLVEMHGGRIEAHSPGLGQGSEFVVRLPRQAAADLPAASRRRRSRPRRRGRAACSWQTTTRTRSTASRCCCRCRGTRCTPRAAAPRRWPQPIGCTPTSRCSTSACPT